jgi:hypothetical protein
MLLQILLNYTTALKCRCPSRTKLVEFLQKHLILPTEKALDFNKLYYYVLSTEKALDFVSYDANFYLIALL